ncbi:MAG: exonuclease [Euryarchaeota archaeon]|nr:exonuclease [Euryarchaeota archaeon]
MIRRTFLILPSIGCKTEARLWQEGIVDWNDFVAADQIKGVSKHRKESLDNYLEVADQFLERGVTGYFCQILPTVEHWRMFDRFEDDCAYIDIETDGQYANSNVTVVGIHRAGQTTTLVQGEDLNESNISKALEGAKMLITFNGSSFDLPILHYHFPMAVPRLPHYDLRHACRRVGLTGGLKKIERELEIARPREVEYVTGEEAVYLWRTWKRKGSKNALKLLMKYNQEDTENMIPIARKVYDQLRVRTLDMERV